MGKDNKTSISSAIAVVVTVLFVAFLLSVVLCIPVWLLWNWLMPAIFGLTKVSLIQAWGLSFLSGLLFRSGIGSKNS